MIISTQLRYSISTYLFFLNLFIFQMNSWTIFKCAFYSCKNWLIAKLFLTEVTGGMERKCDSDDIYESEFSRQAVKKAAERFEKVASEESLSSPRMPPPSLSSLGARGRSKSIGHSLAQKLQEADEEVAKPVLPWAVLTDDQVSILQLNFGSKYFL